MLCHAVFPEVSLGIVAKEKKSSDWVNVTAVPLVAVQVAYIFFRW